MNRKEMHELSCIKISVNCLTSKTDLVKHFQISLYYHYVPIFKVIEVVRNSKSDQKSLSADQPSLPQQAGLWVHKFSSENTVLIAAQIFIRNKRGRIPESDGGMPNVAKVILKEWHPPKDVQCSISQIIQKMGFPKII